MEEFKKIENTDTKKPETEAVLQNLETRENPAEDSQPINKNEGDIEKTNVLENFNTEDLMVAGSRLISALKERDEERLIPIIEPEEVGKMISGFRNIEDGVKSKKIEQVESGFENIGRALETIGNADRRGAMHEDEESLLKVGFAIRDLQGIFSSKINPLGESDSLVMKIQRINNVIDNKKLYISRRIELLRDYNN